MEGTDFMTPWSLESWVQSAFLPKYCAFSDPHTLHIPFMTQRLPGDGQGGMGLQPLL